MGELEYLKLKVSLAGMVQEKFLLIEDIHLFMKISHLTGLKVVWVETT